MKYLLGCNSAKGFYSNYQYLTNKQTANHCYIIKGSPGSGKSSFMKKIADHFTEKGFLCDYIYCSGDPHSLDAISIPKLQISFVDGTAPHIIDPEYPGAVDSIINMGEYWKEDMLSAVKADIIEKFAQYKKHYSVAYRFLSTVGSILNDNTNLVYKYVDFDKMNQYVEGYINSNLQYKFDEQSTVRYRFIDSITCDGIISFANELAKISGTNLVINDLGSMGTYMLSKILKAAISNGYDVDVYSNSIFPQTSISAIHIVNTATSIFVSDEIFKADIDNVKHINIKRFIDMEKFDECKVKYSFNIKIIKSLIKEIVTQLNSAKLTHDKIEAYYIKAMDFKKLDELCAKYIAEIEKKTCSN